jgi:hypothetical protein
MRKYTTKQLKITLKACVLLDSSYIYYVTVAIVVVVIVFGIISLMIIVFVLLKVFLVYLYTKQDFVFQNCSGKNSSN